MAMFLLGLSSSANISEEALELPLARWMAHYKHCTVMNKSFVFIEILGSYCASEEVLTSLLRPLFQFFLMFVFCFIYVYIPTVCMYTIFMLVTMEARRSYKWL